MSIGMNAIKTNIKTLLDNQNTALGSPVDLSLGMTRRVQKILKINLERLPIQASFYPAVTIFFDQKNMSQDTIAKTQAIGKRRADVAVKVAGVVYNANLTSNLEDPADEDLEKLMENVEEILRSDPTLVGSATWSQPSDVTYHSGPGGEEAHVRVGILTLNLTVFY